MTTKVPVIDAYRDGNHLKFWCDHCCRWHFHGVCAKGHNCTPRSCSCPPGTGDGHRVAHCDPDSPYCGSGYILREVPGLPPKVCVRCARRARRQSQAATPLHCGRCGRHLGKNRPHILLGPEPYSTDRLLCIRCMVPPTGTRPLHREYYPNCPEDWHDLYDHPTAHCTRAAAAHLLGLWP